MWSRVKDVVKARADAAVKAVKAGADAAAEKLVKAAVKVNDNFNAAPDNVKTAFDEEIDQTVTKTQDTSNIEQKLHLGTLTSYLPIIVVAVIVLISMVSSDLMKYNWPIVASLILTFIYIAYVHYL